MKSLFSMKSGLLGLLLLSISTQHLPAHAAQKTAATSQEETLDLVQIMNDPQAVQQIKNSVLNLIPALFSKIEGLKLALSNNVIKLSADQKNAILANLATPVDAFKEGITLILGDDQNPVSDKDGLVAGLFFCDQLTTYLNDAIKNNFKGMQPFSFTYQPRELTPQEIVTLLEKVFKGFQELEQSFNEIGTPKRNILAKKMGAFAEQHNVVGKAKAGTMIIFAALLARYLLKYQKPSFSDQDFLSLLIAQKYAPVAPAAPALEAAATTAEQISPNQSTPAPAPTQAAPEAPKNVHTPTLGNKLETFIQGNRFTHWIDGYVVGERPVYDRNGQLIGGGTGLFGHLHAFALPAATLFGFAVALNKFFDGMVDGVNSWKSLHKNPETFFKIDELFKNKKQTISAIDEFFLSSAIEHAMPTLTFKDVAGLEEQKKALQPVIDYLLNPELFEKTGTSVEKGYLLYGPTRTGKTYLAEALAGELMFRYKKPLGFIKVRGSELRLVGIKKVLDMVNKHAPCIVFIDELDLLNLQRDHNASLLDEFLTSMKPDSGRQVIFLAATNRIDHIDHALLQPGRFGKIIPFENPTSHDRGLFFEKHLSRKNMYNPQMLDIDRLITETEGCSFGDLASIINNAIALATQNREMLSYHHFDVSIDTLKHKVVDQEISLPHDEQELIAAHIAGQTLAYHLLPTGETLHKATILPLQKKIAEENIWLSNHTTVKKVTTYGEVFTLHKTNTGGFNTREQKTNCIKALLAGPAAEKIVFGTSSNGYRNEDREQARLLAEALVFQGLKKDHFSREAADKKLDEVMNLLQQCENEVTKMLQGNKGKLDTLRKGLIEKRTLTAQDITALLN